MAIIQEFGTAPAARELGYTRLVGTINGESQELLEKYKDQDVIFVKGARIPGATEMYEFGVFRKTDAAEYEISYAYPTSPHAAKAGFPKCGCFIYQSSDKFQGFTTLDDVKNYALIAGTTPGRWSLDHPENAHMIPQM